MFVKVSSNDGVSAGDWAEIECEVHPEIRVCDDGIYLAGGVKGCSEIPGALYNRKGMVCLHKDDLQLLFDAAAKAGLINFKIK
ncbi:TPA: hypothetical protein NKZ93_001416 [Vibrio parahaemolyticus]|nr:hypothetical protein [Vibrio parahaemolyticus]